MVITLLLAQLVLPGPPSGPIQPPGMICASGGCERGPVVYRTSAGRNRLVVACDMTSDTCSDGRKITTTRSTPVPCETSPGVWEMVPENTACISWRGLESWAANTSYLAYGAELGRSPWTSGGAAGHVVRVYDVEGTNRMCQEAPLSPTSPAGRYQLTPIPTEAGTNTLSCIARPNTGLNIRLNAGDSSKAAIFPMEPGWARYTHSTEVEEGQGDAMSVYTLGQTCIDITGCWYTKTSTPGRACWGGEAPVTCATDQHTISTEGWPSEAGEVSLVYTPGQAENAARYLISSYTFGVEGWEFYVRHDDTMSFLVHNDGTTIYSSAPLAWEPRPYALRVRWGDGIVSFWRDGVLVGTNTLTRLPNGLKSTATIGRRGTSGEVNGSIRSLTVRSFE